MTDVEVSRLIDDLITAFPERRYTSMSDDQKLFMVDAWCVPLADYSDNAIRTGLKKVLQTNTFFPKPAELIEASKQSCQDPMDIMAQNDADYRALFPKEWAADGLSYNRRTHRISEKRLEEAQPLRLAT